MLRLRLLGGLQVEGCDGSRLERRQLRTLLKILALARGRPVGVDRLVDCLWSDQPPRRPADQVSVLVSRLRGVVGNDRVPRTDAGYVLLVDWLDVDALADYRDEADRRLRSGAFGAARAAASAGLALVRGPLLADEVDPWWARVEQAEVDLLVSGLQHTAASASLAADDFGEAIRQATASLVTDPYDEVALRILMAALDRSGRPASALAAYADARTRLVESLGVSPSEETETLHSSILAGGTMGGEPSPVRAGPAAAELHGRGEALDQLQALLDRAEHGRGQVAQVEGEAGIGKSSLLAAWSAALAADGVGVVRVGCDELGRAVPFQPLLDAVAVLVREPVVSDTVDVLGPDAAVLAPLLDGDAVAGGSSQIAALTDPGAGQALLVASLFSVMRRRAQRSPLVLIIDDVHLADSATMAWLAQSARRLADSRVVVVTARRAEEGGAVPRATTIALGPLDFDAAAAIVGATRAPELYARSGGHPLFLVELAASDPGDALPATIRDAVEERCTRSGAAAVTIRAAAVIGPEVYLDLLSAVTAIPPGVLLDHLEEGVRRRLLLERGETFVFVHALVREALASTVGAARAAYLHREAARALGARPDADPLAVARHARLGGALAFASEMLVLAARVAVGRFDGTEALRLLDEAVALDDTATARLERARVASMVSRDDLVDEDVLAARRLGAGPEVLEVAAWSAHFARRFDRARDLADRGAHEAVDPDLRTNCLALGGWISLATGDLAGAADRLEGAVGLEPAVDLEPAAGGLADAWLAWLRMNQGRPAETLALVTVHPGEGLASYRFPNAYALMASTMASAMLGRVDDALTTLATLEADVERMGAKRWAPRPRNLRGWILRNLGAYAEADDHNQAAIEQAGHLGLDEPLANGLLDLASGRLLLGAVDEAAALLDRARPFADLEHAFRWRHVLRGRLLLARVQLAGGDDHAAHRTASALVADAIAVGVPRYALQAQLVAAMAAHRTGTAVDLEEVDRWLCRLDDMVALEGWWLTAQVAREFAVGSWDDLARRRLAALEARAGPYAGDLRRAASAHLG